MQTITIFLRNPAGPPQGLPPVCMSDSELKDLSDHWTKCFMKATNTPGGGVFRCKALGRDEEKVIILNFADIVAIV